MAVMPTEFCGDGDRNIKPIEVAGDILVWMHMMIRSPVCWILALMVLTLGLASGAKTQAFKNGYYTQSLLPLVDGNYSCVLILQPQVAPGGDKYDFSIWIQRRSLHVWFALHDKAIAPTNLINLYEADRPVMELPVIREARPSAGVDAVMADASGSDFLSKLLSDDNRHWEFRIGPDRYPIPADGLSVALQKLNTCGQKLG